jgi:hypothetical protein
MDRRGRAGLKCAAPPVFGSFQEAFPVVVRNPDYFREI